MNHGGVLYEILWALSIVKLDEKVKESRNRLEKEFDRQIQENPDDMALSCKKAHCLEKFDQSNKNTTDHVAAARDVFAKYPEFSGLLLTDPRGELFD